jgi:hypothetical protein
LQVGNHSGYRLVSFAIIECLVDQAIDMSAENYLFLFMPLRTPLLVTYGKTGKWREREEENDQLTSRDKQDADEEMLCQRQEIKGQQLPSKTLSTKKLEDRTQ